MSREGTQKERDSSSESPDETYNQPPTDTINSATRRAHNEWVEQQRNESRRQADLARIRAHERVREDWMKHHDEPPEDVREVVWGTPLLDPLTYISEQERRFCRTRQRRLRVLRWKGELPGGLA